VKGCTNRGSIKPRTHTHGASRRDDPDAPRGPSHLEERSEPAGARGAQPQRAVRSGVVVVLHVDAENAPEMAAGEDQEPTQTLSPHRPDPAFGECVAFGELTGALAASNEQLERKPEECVNQ
jgi:hypothetical protein